DRYRNLAERWKRDPRFQIDLRFVPWSDLEEATKGRGGGTAQITSWATLLGLGEGKADLASSPTTRNRVFISYSHEDERWRKRLATHLAFLERQGLTNCWDDTEIEP